MSQLKCGGAIRTASNVFRIRASRDFKPAPNKDR